MVKPKEFDAHWWQSHALYGRVHQYTFFVPPIHWGCGIILAVPRGFIAVGQFKEFCTMAKTAKQATPAETFAQRLLNRKKDSSDSTQAGFDQELIEATPRVHELLVTVLRDEKKVLEPASLLVFARGGSFHCCLSHKALDLRWWGEGPGLKQALLALEANVAKEEGQGPSNGGAPNTGHT